MANVWERGGLMQLPAGLDLPAALALTCAARIAAVSAGSSMACMQGVPGVGVEGLVQEVEAAGGKWRVRGASTGV